MEAVIRKYANRLDGWYSPDDTRFLLKKAQKSTNLDIELKVVQTTTDVEECLNALQKSQVIAVDSETNGIARRHKAYTLQMCSNLDKSKVWIVSLNKISGKAKDRISTVLSSPDIFKLGQNLKFDVRMLGRSGIKVKPPLFDTYLGYKVLRGGSQQSASLDFIAWDLCQISLDKTQRLTDWTKSLNSEQLWYSAVDVVVLFPIVKELVKQLRTEGLEQIAYEEFEALYPIFEMEEIGIKIDLAGLASCLQEVKQEKIEVQTRISAVLGLNVNLNSPVQLTKALQALGLKVKSASLESLTPYIQEKIVQDILRYRHLVKLESGHLSSLPKSMESDERVRGAWSQIGTRTGRTSCKEPNLANIPRDSKIRRCIVAREGWSLIKADYSQIELRIMAKLANCRTLINAYIEDQDVHTITARQILGKEFIDKEDRRFGKIINFGLIYGMGMTKFIQVTAAKYLIFLSPEEVQVIYQRFFGELYPEIKAYHNKQAIAKTKGLRIVRSLHNRKTEWLAAPDLTKLVNYPDQSTCSDIIKRAIGIWYRWSRQERLRARMILTKYDEILVESPDYELSISSQLLEASMVQAGQSILAPIPCIVDLQIGKTWAA